jgi:hypothetical protein
MPWHWLNSNTAHHEPDVQHMIPKLKTRLDSHTKLNLSQTSGRWVLGRPKHIWDPTFDHGTCRWSFVFDFEPSKYGRLYPIHPFTIQGMKVSGTISCFSAVIVWFSCWFSRNHFSEKYLNSQARNKPFLTFPEFYNQSFQVVSTNAVAT